MPSDDLLIRRLVWQTIIWLIVLAAILFLAAGTLDWPQAWVLLIESGALGLASGIAIARRDPQLVRERMLGLIQKEQKPWDKALLAVILALTLAIPIIAGLEVRFGSSAMPVWLNVLGAAALAVATYMFHVVLLANSYATTVVRIQSDRGQQVISSGPYAYVRHPMYAGAIFYFVGFALLLGSWYAVAVAVNIVALFALRAVWEEETLIAELAGYADYARRVRHRLIPGVW